MFIVVTKNALKIELSIEKVHIYIHICINNTHIIKSEKGWRTSHGIKLPDLVEALKGQLQRFRTTPWGNIRFWHGHHPVID